MADKGDDHAETYKAFHEAVNMTAAKLDAFLKTDESQSVGQKKDGGEATGHREGRRIVELLGTKAGDLSDDDLQHMQKVTSYVKRHSAQEPSSEDVEDSKWRYSLMNWGHDPLA